MNGLLFFSYLYLLGFLFASNFRPRISLPFILYSSFLWGALLFSLTLLITHIFGILPTSNLLVFLAATLILIPLLFFFAKKTYRLFTHREAIASITVAVIFLLINYFFHIFNFSLATFDSFALLMLARVVAYEGFSPSALYSFTSWGVLIPLLQSMSLFLKTAYLPTLAANFSLTLVALFVYAGLKIGKAKENAHYLLTISLALLSLVFITTPMFIIQTFYIHTNVPAACFFLAATILCVENLSVQHDKKILVLFFLLCLGLCMCRTESFIYSIPIILLLFSFHPTKNRPLFLLSVLFFSLIMVWLYSLFNGIQTGTDILDKSRIYLLIISLAALIIVLGFLQIERIGRVVAPLIEKYFLVPFVLLNITMLAVKPAAMWASNVSVVENLLFYGYWGVVFWVWIAELILNVFLKPHRTIIILNKLIASFMLIITGLGFFRPPYHIFWTDSANRLMTLVFPLVLLTAFLTVQNIITPDRLPFNHVNQSRKQNELTSQSHPGKG
jgi:hypothetical protein